MTQTRSASVGQSVATEHIGFFIKPMFPMAALSAAIDVLALANRASSQALYRWSFFSETGDDVESMNGSSVRTVAYSRAETDLDRLIVFAGLDGSARPTSETTTWLRRLYARGCHVGAASTGSWTLAWSGLLAGKRCTIHWEDIDAFREMFSELTVTEEIFEVDGRIFTCSGGIAVADLFLFFVAERAGLALASAVAEQIVHSPMRNSFTYQRTRTADHVNSPDDIVIRAVGLMERHIETPISQHEIADRLATTSRRIEREFNRVFGRTPQLHYRKVRLRRAEELLRATNLTATEIAFACGFTTSSYFSKCFSTEYGCSPSQFRRSQPEGR